MAPTEPLLPAEEAIWASMESRRNRACGRRRDAPPTFAPSFGHLELVPVVERVCKLLDHLDLRRILKALALVSWPRQSFVIIYIQ